MKYSLMELLCIIEILNLKVMSGYTYTDIEKAALDFINVYKHYKNRNRKVELNAGEKKILLRRGPVKKDKHPC